MVYSFGFSVFLMCFIFLFCFFFFKQKTAYEMRISDWSSDVCSSDLLDQGVAGLDVAALLGGLDHAHADAVLDRTAGVLVLELQVQLAGAGIQAPGLDDGRIADEFEDGGMDRHAALAEKHGARLS